MAKKNFIVHLDLNKNELMNAVVHRLATAPAAPGTGQIYYNTGDNILYGYNGTDWIDLMAVGGGSYTHPPATNGAYSLNMTGASVLAVFNTDADGHVDQLTTRTLTLADLGYTPYSHPTGGDLAGPLTGADVISDVTVDTEGHVTGFTTRALTAADIGAAVINDAATSSTTETWSVDKITLEIANAIAGGMNYIGNYDANLNTPDLETPAAGTVIQGDTYTVSAAGTFFTADVEAGDLLIAKIDDPATLADWSVVNKNIPAIGDATELVRGLIQLATQAEVWIGTDAEKAVTPDTLQGKLDGDGSTNLRYTRVYSQLIGDGVATAITVTHNLNTTAVAVEVKEGVLSVVGDWNTPSVNTVTFSFNTAPTVDQYNVTIVG